MKNQIINSVCFLAQALACLCLFTVTSLYAAETNDNPGQLSASDYKFACDAARGGNMEVKLGKLATVRALDSAIQQFGQRMADDHGKAGDQLQHIALQKGAVLPADLTKTQQLDADKLDALSGTDFDNAYLALMVKDHKATLKEFQRAAEETQDPDLKAFAVNTIPIIEDHLKMAENLASGGKIASMDSH